MTFLMLFLSVSLGVLIYLINVHLFPIYIDRFYNVSFVLCLFPAMATPRGRGSCPLVSDFQIKPTVSG
ncbi:hypothetical protein ETAE_2919 [Edwardsiella piscicida]|uniref:Uncharacterized protein n=1 Tax=Edwardsiella piscicida TaxID=1263550 RepID=A0AAU8P816_EDWPI|nr:hypothetical protein ETAE_2919 [Edwardsiella tarda EIB202]